MVKVRNAKYISHFWACHEWQTLQIRDTLPSQKYIVYRFFSLIEKFVRHSTRNPIGEISRNTCLGILSVFFVWEYLNFPKVSQKTSSECSLDISGKGKSKSSCDSTWRIFLLPRNSLRELNPFHLVIISLSLVKKRGLQNRYSRERLNQKQVKERI